MSEPREKTKDEVVEEILDYVNMLIKYWAHESRRAGAEEKLEGFAHSMLTMLDGCSANLPAFNLVPCPCPDDKEYLKDIGENWYPEIAVNDTVMLHDLFMERRRK